MRFVTKSLYVEAIQFKYSKEGIDKLQDFTDGNVIRYGPKRLPTMGGFAYVKFPNQFLVIDNGDYVIKWLNTGEFHNMPEKEFLEKFDSTENIL
jgi:hypothetical protein